jgi:hypothetical protein
MINPTIRIFLDTNKDGIPEDDISDKVISDLEYEHGILSNKDVDLIASPGSLRFVLMNFNDEYTEAQLNGSVVRVEVSYFDKTKNVFYGTIAKVNDNNYILEQSMSVEVGDWFQSAINAPIKNVQLAINKTADEAIPTLLSVVPNAPLNTDLDVGFESFESMFDGVKTNSVVYSELQKITNSELGSLYLKFRDPAAFETLRLENYLSRGSTRSLNIIPRNIGNPTLLKYHDGAGGSGYIKYHGSGGTSGRIKLSENQEAVFDKSMIDSDWNRDGVINEFNLTINPRFTDDGVGVLFNLDSPIVLPPASRPNNGLSGSYSDPIGSGLPVIAYDVVTPVDTTDYRCFQFEDGSGTEYTGNVTIASFTWGANGFSVEFKNTGLPCYLTYFRVRGKVIRKFNPIKYFIENTESKEEFVRVVKSEALSREYSSSYNTSKTFADGIVALERYPNKSLRSVTFLANHSEDLLLAYMYLEQGDKVRIIDNRPDHTGDYYIQGVKAVLALGGIIFFTWFLKEEVNTLCQPIAVKDGTYSSGSRQAIDFGVLPYLANMSHFSYSVWIKRLDYQAFAVLVNHSLDTGSGRRGNYFLMNTNGDLQFSSYKTPTDGHWEHASALFDVNNVWRHVVLTYDNTTDTADPRIYVDGTEISVTENYTPSGTSDDDSDCPLILFNIAPNPSVAGQQYFYNSSKNAILKDIRIYNRILTQSEITELANGEDDYSTVQDGLQFQGIYAPKDNINDYIGDVIDNQDLVLDSVHKAAGIPYNENTSDTTKMLSGLDL